MKNSIKMLGNFLIIALVAIIGFSMAACSEDPESDTVTIANIPGITAPVIGATPVSQITPTAQYTGIVSWSPSGVFQPMTVYTATITLYEKEGWTCRGVPANFFTVAGATATNAADSYIITAVFPATDLTTVTFSSITDMDTWLKSQSGNTEETPYLVKLNVSDLKGKFNVDGSAGKTLRSNHNSMPKYVILDLSGSTITSIGDESFSLCDNIVGLIIGNTVTSIGDHAFSVCSALKSVTIPESVTLIDERAFYNCQALTNVTIPAKVTTIGREAFIGCISITSINIPAAVTSIGSEAFSNCYALTAINVATENANYISDDGILYNKAKTTLTAYPAGKAGASFTIPDGVTSIGSGAFDGNRNLTDITIPASFTSLSGNYFTGFAQLVAINVVDSNANYCSDNGILYNKAKTTLVRCPPSKTFLNGVFTIPAAVTTIDNYAFRSCVITSITIPATVTKIGSWAFESCSYLTSVTFEGTIASANFGTTYPFTGDLRTKFYATDSANGTPGTYTRTNNDPNTWTKQP